MFRSFVKSLFVAASPNRSETIARVNESLAAVEQELNQANPCARLELLTSLVLTANTPATLQFGRNGALWFDAFKWWDAALFRWVPKETQVFAVTLKLQITTGANGTCTIRKNGTVVATSIISGEEMMLTTIVPMNGATDYIDFVVSPGALTGIVSRSASYATFHAVGRLTNG